MKVSKTGGPPVLFADRQLSAGGIAVDEANVYWTNEGNRQHEYRDGAVLYAPK